MNDRYVFENFSTNYNPSGFLLDSYGSVVDINASADLAADSSLAMALMSDMPDSGMNDMVPSAVTLKAYTVGTSNDFTIDTGGYAATTKR